MPLLTKQINFNGGAQGSYIADDSSLGGSTYDYGTSPTNLASLTNPATNCYRTVRYDTANGSMSQSGFAANASVLVRLHVYVDGNAVLTKYTVTDAYSNVGSVDYTSGNGSTVRPADITEFYAQANSSGVVSLTFAPNGGTFGRWMISAIELTEQAAPPDSTPPTDVVLSTPSALGQTSARFPFTPSTDASGILKYHFQFDKVNTFNSGSLIDEYYNGTTSPYDKLSGLSVGEEWYARAKAVDNSANQNQSTNWSNIVSVTTWNAAPTFTTAANLGNVNINESTDFNIVTSGGNGTKTISAPDGLSAGASLVGNVLTINRGTTGAFSQKLRVTDANGQYTERTFTATLIDPNAAPPVAAFTVPPMLGVDQTFTPVNQSTNADSYAWDKENDSVTDSTDAEPVFSYSTIGTKTIKLTATNAYGSDEATHTIEVSELDYISFCHKRPLKRTLIQKLRVFEPLEGTDEVIEDAAPKYEFNLQLLYIGGVNGDDLRQFLYDHRKRQPFIWYNPDRDETRIVKMITPFSEEEMLAYGGFEIVLRDV